MHRNRLAATIAVCLAMLLILPSAVQAAPSVSITLSDVVQIAKYITGQGTLTAEQLKEFDFTGDGRVTLTDLTRAVVLMLDQETAPAQPGMISLEDAKNDAARFAGVRPEQITKISLEHTDSGYPVYEGEFSSGGKSYEFEIDAYTGERLSWSWKTKPVPGSGTDIGRNGARDIALAEVPGAAQSDVRAVSRDMEDGVPVYEVLVDHGNYAYEFLINSTSGVIIEWSMDYTGPERPVP